MTKEEIKEYVNMAIDDSDLNILSYLASSIDSTIAFIKESTDKEFYTVSSYFDDLAYMSNSKEFVEAIEERFIKIKDTSLDLKYICQMIQYAKENFPEEEY